MEDQDDYPMAGAIRCLRHLEVPLWTMNGKKEMSDATNLARRIVPQFGADLEKVPGRLTLIWWSYNA